MSANSSSLTPNVFIYTHTDFDDPQLIEKLNSVFAECTPLYAIEQLKDCLVAHPTSLIIVTYPLIHPDLIDITSGDNSAYITTILIAESHVTDEDATHFDFALLRDNNLIPLLQQIAHFHQKKIDQLQKHIEHIRKLEHDLSRQKEQTDQVEILKEAIVRNVSHELKTPLLHVKSAVSLMAEDVGKENKLIRYAENATARLETLVTNITMFGSSLDLNLSPVIARDAVEYAHRNLLRSWESKEQAKRIRLYIDDDLPPVLADRQGLSTILQLLLDNALKFSDGTIEVHVHQIEDTIEFAVRDYGIGIHPNNLKSIFESFYQIDPSSTRRYGGTGVGLALVKLLIEKHQSEIKVDSKLDEGSKFSFRLQIAHFIQV